VITLWEKLNGNKTKIAGYLALALVVVKAIGSAAGFTVPEEVDKLAQDIIASLGGVGVAHKAVKVAGGS
jgi:purine-cytosine permease-like protein